MSSYYVSKMCYISIFGIGDPSSLGYYWPPKCTYSHRWTLGREGRERKERNGEIETERGMYFLNFCQCLPVSVLLLLISRAR